MKSKDSIKGFSLTGLFIILAVVIVTVTAVFYFLRPNQLVQKNRDVQRMNDLKEMASAINLLIADGKDFSNLKSTYNSDTQVEQPESINGTGWIPLNFQAISSGSPLAKLYADPINNEDFHYTLGLSRKDKTFELNAKLEVKDNLEYSRNDFGNNAGLYEVGTDLTILP